MKHFKNSQWYDKVPVMVSFPRCGCNWLQAVMELYFNRHRTGKSGNSPSWVTNTLNDEKPLWAHTHDQSKEMHFTTNQPVLYLWRDPVDVLFSLFKLPNRLKINNENHIKEQAKRYGLHYRKWINLSKESKVLLVQYEDVKKFPHEQMKRISNFFGHPFDWKKSKEAFSTVGNKKKVNEKNGPNSLFKNAGSHTEQYSKERENFKNKWGCLIINVSKVPTRYKDL